MNDFLFNPLSQIGKFTKIQLGKLQKLLGDNPRIIDLLYYFPCKYNKYCEISEASSALIGSEVIIQMKICKHHPPIYHKKGNTPYKIYCLTKGEEKITITFFKYLKNYVQKFEVDTIVKVRGRLNFYNNQYSIAHPSLLQISQDFTSQEQDLTMQNIQPKYSLTQGVKNADISLYIQTVLELFSAEYQAEKASFLDHYPEYLKQDLPTMLREIHKPKNEEEAGRAIKYFAFEEFLAIYSATHQARVQKGKIPGISMVNSHELKDKILQNFTHNLTQDQESALKTIENSHGEKKVQLIQGDVGSGKTIVAIIACANVIESGYSAIILAPTTILANQHYQLAKKLFSGTNTRCELITGRLQIRQKRQITQDFRKGDIDLLIGTHALFNEDIIHSKIGLIIIDEQHRFGVNQRLNLIEKSQNASVMMMSATPIPRTLAMGLYGDIEIIEIKQKPAFQKEIITSIISMDKYFSLIDHVKNSINHGEKIYWVCPLIDDENGDGGVIKRFADLTQYFPKEEIGLLYGSLKEAEKDAIIQQFQEGIYKVLISTTVVEVGVNIPDATIIIIEDSHRFGLSQLHQLRGRVGRGNKQSYCILLYQDSENYLGMERLKVIKENSNGFEIAKYDMKMRGTGNVLGEEQSGGMGYKIANITRDIEVMEEVCNFAKSYYHTTKDDIFLKQFITRVLQIYFPNDFEKYLLG